ncbi:YfiT family bacillithiol transferase [Neobacillus ginsengisoli]|uniref:Putative metal-dependent hydrolase J2S10_003319 n=1 Tax=Neobacillus ginsengisoli TaxID=904295 RepID=A0ABT9XX40_9BACI|nr:bacillithiol transferase BstA [Neobacillus ginsengisoli]MDQ0200136.1 hypothetical protein [Neobacillus ginsengisoli]
MNDLRYPIGYFNTQIGISDILIENWINVIEMTPSLLRDAVRGLNDEQLDTPYRPGGWTVRQVVHHLPDSHLNSYVRFKLALTEDTPTIKPYMEDKWAELPDSKLPVEISLKLLEGLHNRWVNLLRSLGPDDLEKTFLHPDSGEISLGLNIGLYAWHCQHHLAHINSLRERQGW